MTHAVAMVLAACLLAVTAPLQAAEACTFAVKPEMHGFALNPILGRVIVTAARASTAGDTCPLRLNDEIVQVNQQVIPGQRALAVMKYWKSIKDGTVATFKVRRGDAVLVLAFK